MVLEQLWDSGLGVLSTRFCQNCASTCAARPEILCRGGGPPLIREYSTWEVVANTPESVLKALDIEMRYKTSFWDALILQAAENAAHRSLLGRFGDGTTLRAIQVVNPLVDSIAP